MRSVLVVAPALLSTSLAAQSPDLRVLRHTPDDTASSGNVVTVTFDRPVAGRLDEMVDASRIFRIDPAVPGEVAWRDPVTIRFVPDEPLVPGSAFTVTVDTAFRAIDGSRLATPYRFAFRVPGPRLLQRSYGAERTGIAGAAPLDGKLLLLYSAPVDSAALAGVRLELKSCEAGPRTIPLAFVRQRRPADTDPYPFRSHGWGSDTTARRFHRVVELAPDASLPPECTGDLVIPTVAEDAVHGAEERFGVATPPRFRLVPVPCPLQACAVDRIELRFSVPVSRELVERFVRLEPGGPARLGESYRIGGASWTIPVALKPRAEYTIVVDSAIRDHYGRALEGPHRQRIVTGDYAASVSYARGIITVPRTGARTIPVRHVNAGSVRVLTRRVPEQERVATFANGSALFDPFPDGAGTDTMIVALRGRFNEEHRTELSLPAWMFAPGAGPFALRIEVAEPLAPPPAPRDTAGARRLPGVRVVADAVTRSQPRYALIQVTDLAVHAKLGMDEGRVFVTGLPDGRAMRGVTVRKYDRDGNVIATGVTDRTGIAELRIAPAAGARARDPQARPIGTDWPPRAAVLEAAQGADRVLTPLEGLRRIGFAPYDPFRLTGVGGEWEEPRPAAATLMAERGIYRPGEMLYLKGILRRGPLGELRGGKREQVRLSIVYRPHRWDRRDDVTIRDTVLLTSGFGTITDSLRIPARASLGSYLAELQVDGPDRWTTVASVQVEVAEYRAPEFLVEARVDSASIAGADTAAVDVAARYLFGAPMGNAQVRWHARLDEVQERPRIPGAEGWAVGTWERGERSAPVERWGADSLDATGALALRIPTSDLRPKRAGRVTVDVTVVDVNRQTVSTSVHFTVPAKPDPLYLLAKAATRDWFWTVGSPVTIAVRAVDGEGREIPGVPVTARIVRREWTWDGRSTQWRESLVRTDTLRGTGQGASLTFEPSRTGRYDVELSAEAGEGDTARTVLGAWAFSSGERWFAEGPYHLPLVASRTAAAVGDEVEVAFDSPFDDAEAWIAVEREGEIERRRLRVSRGRHVVPLRITGVHVPNVYVSVVLTRRTAAPVRPDSAADLLRAGYVRIAVDPDAKRLAVTLLPRATEYGPGDSARVAVRVKDAAGRGVLSEVTVWAVDEGVLALTGYATPDPIALMYRPRRLGASLWSTVPMTLTSDPGLLMRLGQETGLALEAVVLRAAVATVPMSPATLRSTFRPTAFFVGAATTDADGNVIVRAKLPDDLTTYRIMAVAVGPDGRFGSGDSTLLVTRQLVARPSLPRFVRPGDTLSAGAVVNVRDGGSRRVAVAAESDGIALQGSARREIVLAAGKGAEATFDFAAPGRGAVGDTVAIRLRASDGKSGDAAETRLPVKPDFHPRTHTQLGVARGTSEIVFDLPADVDPDRSQLRLQLGTSPLAPMLAAWEWLRVYPYDCTEQIASGGRALIAVWRATRGTDSLALGGDPRPRLQALADELVTRQREDGGFRYWRDFAWTSPWLSAYAGRFLLEARAEGIAVDSAVFARLSEYLDTAARAPLDTGGINRFDRRARRLALGDRVAAVELLRLMGAPAVPAEDALLRVAGQMTWEDRLRLAEALAPRPDTREVVGALVDAAWAAATPAGRRVDLPDTVHAERVFPSRIAPAARLLTASLALRPAHPMLGGLVESVLQHGRAEGRWAWSTQDYASLVMALSRLSTGTSRLQRVELRRGRRTLLAREVGGADSSGAVPLTRLLERGRDGGTRLRVELHTDAAAGPLYFAVSVVEVPSRPPVTPDIGGIVVERWYERFEDGRPVTSVGAGDLVRVRLRVTVPVDRQYVALEDPLPAGLEPVNLRLRTSATLTPFLTPEARAAEAEGDRGRDGPGWQSWLYGSWDEGWWSPWEHKAMHDDKVVFFARMLWQGTYTASYVARATTPGTFTRPPAHAEEMYNPAVRGRSDGGRFEIGGGAGGRGR